MHKECYIIGAGSLLISCATILLENNYQLKKIFSNDAATIEWAQERKLPICPLRELTSCAEPVSYIFSINNNTILPKEFLALATTAAINYHNSQLPKYAGMNVVTWALLNREKSHGITWHLMRQQVDSGDILQQRGFPLTKKDTALSVNLKCYEAALSTFAQLINNQITATPQNLSSRSYYSGSTQIPMNGIVSWDHSAADISALVRGLNFGNLDNPLCMAKILVGDTSYVIREVGIARSNSELSAGNIVKITKQKLYIATTTANIIINNLYTVTDSPITISQLIKKHELTTGMPLATLKIADNTKLEQINQKSHKEEGYLLDLFREYEYSALPCPLAAHQKSASKKNSYEIKLDNKTLETIKTISNEDIKTFLLTSLILYITKICELKKVCIGLNQAKATKKQPLITQLFSTTLPVIAHVDPEDDFIALLNKVSIQARKSENIGYCARDIDLRYKEIKNITKTTPVFPIVVTTHNHDPNPKEYDYLIRLTSSGYKLTCNKKYFSEFCPNFNNLKTLISNILNLPSAKLKEIPIISTQEMNRAYFDWNNDKSVPQQAA